MEAGGKEMDEKKAIEMEEYLAALNRQVRAPE